MIDKLYTVEEVAELASVTGRTIRNYLKSGRLVGRKIGGQWRFPEKEVQRLLNGAAADFDLDDTFEEPDTQAGYSEATPAAGDLPAVSPPSSGGGTPSYAGPAAGTAAIHSGDRPGGEAPFVPAQPSSSARPAIPASQPVGAAALQPQPLPSPQQQPGGFGAHTYPAAYSVYGGMAATQPAAPPVAPAVYADTQAPGGLYANGPSIQATQPYGYAAQPAAPAYPSYPAAAPLQNMAPSPYSAQPAPSPPQDSPEWHVPAFPEPAPSPVPPSLAPNAPPQSVYAQAQAAQAPPRQSSYPAGYASGAPSPAPAAQAAPATARNTPRQQAGEASSSGALDSASASQNPASPSISEIGRKVMDFVAQVHDCSFGPQICSVVELHQSYSATKITSDRLADIAEQESDENQACQSFVEYDERFFIARYTLIGSSSFLLRCLKLIG